MKKITRPRSLIYYLSLMLLVSVSACDTKQTPTKKASETLNIINPYIRAMPPGQKVTAMFMTINNPSLDTFNLVRAESDISEHVEIHEHKNDNGVMRMGQVDKIEIRAQGNTLLEPGGYHIMLIGLKKDLTLGEKINVTLIFKDGSSSNILSTVQKIDVNN